MRLTLAGKAVLAAYTAIYMLLCCVMAGFHTYTSIQKPSALILLGLATCITTFIGIRTRGAV